MKTQNRRVILIAVSALLLAVLACGPQQTPTPTPTVPEVGEVTPTQPPDATEAPAATDTPVPDVTGPGGCTLNAAYVADVTVPDNTEFPPGASLTKTWRIRNSGTCTWEAGTQLVFGSGDPMGGAAAVDVPSVAPGSNTDVSVDFTAPDTPGTYRSTYQMQNPEGTRYGSQIYVQIVVPEPATETPTQEPTSTPTEEPTEAPTEEPTPTPFGGGTGRIAYVSFRDGNAEIYVMEEDDSDPTRLTDNPEIDDWPDWSPDGERIVFTRYFGGKPDVYVMEADGSFQINLTNNPAWDSRPAWSPDGTRIAFDSDRVGGKLQIWVMKVDGSGLVQLTDTPEINSSPDWSPDGNKIAFESQRDGQREIYVMNADGSDPTRLTFTDNNYGPKWSPDGKKIVFSSSDGLWSVKSDGTNLTQVTVNAGPFIFDVHPHWSPDGRRILFDTKRSGNGDLYTVKPDGTNMKQLTTNAADDLNPAWQP
jgi:Tol biopolymer transport system component